MFSNKLIIALSRDAGVLCHAAYKQDAAKAFIEKSDIHHNVTEFAQTHDLDGGFNLSYILAKSIVEQNGVIFLAIRGTCGSENWITNPQAGGATDIEGRSGKVHKGFWELANKLPLSYLQDIANTGTKVVFTGHSFGGAVAAIGAMILMGRVHNKENVCCITFGAPLFADKSIQEQMYQRQEEQQFHHFVAEMDIVPLALNSPEMVKNFLQALIGSSDAGRTRDHIVKNLAPSFEPVGTFKLLGVGSEDQEKAKDHMKKKVLEGKQDIESIQQHSIDFYMEELRSYWNGPHCNECHSQQEQTPNEKPVEIKTFNTDYELIPEMCKVGAKNKKYQDVTLRLQIYGRRNLAFIETLESKDLTIELTEEAISKIEVLKILHTSNHMIYDIKVIGSDFHPHGSFLKIAFRSRFSPSPPQLENLPIQESYFPSRKERIKNEHILETIVQLRHILAAEVQQKINGDPTNADRQSKLVDELLKPYSPHLNKLDKWLNDSVDRLSQKQQEYLKAIINSVANTGKDPREIFVVTGKAVEAVKDCKESEIEWCCSMLHYGEDKSSSEKLVLKFITDPSPLPRDFFTATVTGGLESNNFILEITQSIKMEIMLAVAIGIVFNKLHNQKSPIAEYTATAVQLAGPLTSIVVLGFLLVYFVFFATDWVDLIRNSPFSVTRSYENAMIDMFTEEGTGDLHTREKEAKEVIVKIKKEMSTNKWGSPFRVSQELAHLDFVETFCSAAISLRDMVLKKCTFNIGVVGQPGSGKSTFTSKRAKVFKNAPKFREKTDFPQQICCSDDIVVTDFPGMFGTDTFNGAHPNVFRSAVHTLDAVVIFVKALDRSFKGVEEFVAIIDKAPIYLCITNVDTAIQARMKEIFNREGDDDDNDDDDDDDDDDGNSSNHSEKRARWYQEAIDYLDRWRSEFCRQNKVNVMDAHFVIPSKRLVQAAKEDNKNLVVGGESPIKDWTHVVHWLRAKAKECSDISEGEAKKVIGLDPIRT